MFEQHEQLRAISHNDYMSIRNVLKVHVVPSVIISVRRIVAKIYMGNVMCVVYETECGCDLPITIRSRIVITAYVYSLYIYSSHMVHIYEAYRIQFLSM